MIPRSLIKMKKDEITLIPNATQGTIKIGDKTYYVQKTSYDKDDHATKVVFKEIPKEVWEGLVTKLAEKLVKDTGLTAEHIVRNALNEMDFNTLRAIDKRLNKGEKARLKDGCLSIIVGKSGKTDIPLIG
jgi:hypothetical protein